MKKKLLFIFITFVSLHLFSEEFSLFPWFTNQKDIYNYCINKGWEYSSDVSSKVTSFSFKTPDSVTYHGEKLYAVHFMFDNTGTIIDQAITFSDILEAASTFPVLLEHSIIDKARLLNKQVESNGIFKITVTANISDTINADYVIIGKNDAFQISISYHTY